MPRAIIVHCWEGYPEYCWYPQVKKELEARGIQVEVPAFPETEAPKMEAWVAHLHQVAGEPNEELYLIGHSVGCVAIMRYLETLSENQQIGGAVFVAGYIDDLGYPELSNFFQTPLEFEKIKNRSARGFIAIHSNNDPYVDIKYANILKEKLGAEIIVKHNAGHFSGEDNCKELPEIVTSIERIKK